MIRNLVKLEIIVKFSKLPKLPITLIALYKKKPMANGQRLKAQLVRCLVPGGIAPVVGVVVNHCRGGYATIVVDVVIVDSVASIS